MSNSRSTLYNVLLVPFDRDERFAREKHNSAQHMSSVCQAMWAWVLLTVRSSCHFYFAWAFKKQLHHSSGHAWMVQAQAHLTLKARFMLLESWTGTAVVGQLMQRPLRNVDFMSFQEPNPLLRSKYWLILYLRGYNLPTWYATVYLGQFFELPIAFQYRPYTLQWFVDEIVRVDGMDRSSTKLLSTLCGNTCKDSSKLGPRWCHIPEENEAGQNERSLQYSWYISSYHGHMFYTKVQKILFWRCSWDLLHYSVPNAKQAVISWHRLVGWRANLLSIDEGSLLDAIT